MVLSPFFFFFQVLRKAAAGIPSRQPLECFSR